MEPGRAGSSRTKVVAKGAAALFCDGVGAGHHALHLQHLALHDKGMHLLLKGAYTMQPAQTQPPSARRRAPAALRPASGC